MRSHEERVAETKRRIAKMEREKRRRNTITLASAVRRALHCSSVHPSPCPALPQTSRPAIIPASKRQPACRAAARLWDISSLGFWRFYLACA